MTTQTCDATAEPAGGAASDSSKGSPAARSENALDALLDELQTFSKPADKRGGRPLSADSPVRASSSSASVGSAKPPSGATVVIIDGPGSGGVNKKTPPPPPPRTTSKSPVTSPTGPQRSRSEPVRTNALAAEDASSSSSGSSGGRRDQLSSNSSSSESVNSQEGLQARSRQELLDSRHQVGQRALSRVKLGKREGKISAKYMHVATQALPWSQPMISQNDASISFVRLCVFEVRLDVR